MHRPAIPSILTDAESIKPKCGPALCAINPKESVDASSDKPDMSRPPTGLHAQPLDHRPAIVKPCIGHLLALRKALKDLNPDFLRERAFDPTHPIPEPNDFPLFLDIHWPPPENDRREHIENKIARPSGPSAREVANPPAV
jgi:hypothetical protein